MADRSIQVEFTVDDDGAVRGVRRVDGELVEVEQSADEAGQAGRRMGSAFDNAAGVVAAAAVALLANELRKLARDALQVGMDFEASMSRVQGLSQATDEELGQLTDTARELGATTRFSATEAANGMSFLAMAGFETNEIISAMPGLLDQAAAGQIDLGQAADITSNILGGFNLEAEETARVSDVLTATFTSSNQSLQELGQAMSFVAPVAAGLGLELEEMAAATGLLADDGIKASRAGTTLRAALSRLNEPTGEGARLMQEYNVQVRDAQGELLPLADILEELERAFGDMSRAQRQAALTQIVGQQAASGFASIMSQGSEALREYTEELRDSDGAASEIAETMDDNLRGSVREMQSALEALQLAFFDAYGDDVRNVVIDITRRVRNFTGFISDNADTISGLVGIVGNLTQALVAYVAITRTVTAAIWAKTAAMNAFNVSLSATGIGSLLRLLTAAGAAMWAFTSRTDDATDALREQRREVERLTDSVNDLSDAQAAQRFQEIQSAIEKQTRLVVEAQGELAEMQRELERMEEAGRSDLALARQMSEIREQQQLVNRLREEERELILRRNEAEEQAQSTLSGRISLLRQEQRRLANENELTAKQQEQLIEINEELAELEEEKASRTQVTADAAGEINKELEEEKGLSEEVVERIERKRYLFSLMREEMERMRQIQVDLAEGQLDLEAELENVPGSIAHVNERLRELNEQYRQATDPAIRAELAAQIQEWERKRDAMDELAPAAENATESIDEVSDAAQTAQQAGAQFTTSLVRGLRRGEDAAESLSSSLDSVADMLLSRGIMALLTGASGGGALLAGGAAAAGLGAIIGGSRQFGGPVSAGRVYEINEAIGQQEFFVPSVSGRIEPGPRRGHGGPMRIHVTGRLRGDMGELISDFDEQREIENI